MMLVLVCLVGLSGCTPTNPDQTTTSTSITLQWWGAFWDESVVSSLIAQYENDNPGVTIQYANKWPGGPTSTAAKLYQTELNRVLGGGNTAEIPDIFMVQNDWSGDYEDYVATAPSSILSTDTFKTNFYPAVVTDFTNSSGVTGVPLWIDTYAIIYNQDLLAKQATAVPPTNWVDFKSLAQALTTRSGGNIESAGFSAGSVGNVSFAPELFYILLLQNGVSLTNSAGAPVFANDTDALTALNYFKSFGNVTTGSWAESLDTDAKLFLEGKLAMMVAPSWRYNDILTLNKAYNLNLRIGAAPIPQVQSGGTTIDWATYWGNMVAKDRPNSEAAWKFLNWISQPDQLKTLRANEKINRQFFTSLYPRIDMYQEQQSDQYLRYYNAALPTAQSWKTADGLLVRQRIEDLLDGQASSQAILSAQQDITTIINNAGGF